MLRSRPLPAAAQRIGGLAVANSNSNEVRQLQKRSLPKECVMLWCTASFATAADAQAHQWRV